MEAPLMGISEDIALALPPITMVFCCVDGGKVFASKYRSEAHEVHVIIAGIIRNTLRQAGGSQSPRRTKEDHRPRPLAWVRGDLSTPDHTRDD